METVIRVFVIYVVIVVGLRVLGKREFGQLTPLELVTLLIIPEIVSQALVREDDSVTNAVIGVATLFGLVYLTSLLSHVSEPFERLISSDPTVLIQHGKMLEHNMNKERITPEEIFTEMHKSGLYKLEQVQWAVLETDGKIAVIPEDSARGQQHHAQENTLVG